MGFHDADGREICRLDAGPDELEASRRGNDHTMVLTRTFDSEAAPLTWTVMPRSGEQWLAPISGPVGGSTAGGSTCVDRGSPELVSLEDGTAVNSSAVLVLALAEAGLSVGAIVEVLEREFPRSPHLDRDVVAFLDEAARAGLVRIEADERSEVPK